jgi:hypothetical protein
VWHVKGAKDWLSNRNVKYGGTFAIHKFCGPTSTDLFMSATTSRIEKQFQALLSLVVSQPHLRLSDIRAHLDRVSEEHRTGLTEKMKAANRQKLRSIKRTAVGVSQQTPEESGANPTQ